MSQQSVRSCLAIVGKASLPAFGMAVLRSPPTSRSPSLHGSRSNSVTPATLPPTETPPDTRESAPNEAVGSKRKRGLETEANGVAVEGSEGGKQPRMQAEGTRQQLDGGHVQADAQNLAFKALSHHKYASCTRAALLCGRNSITRCT